MLKPCASGSLANFFCTYLVGFDVFLIGDRYTTRFKTQIPYLRVGLLAAYVRLMLSNFMTNIRKVIIFAQLLITCDLAGFDVRNRTL